MLKTHVEFSTYTNNSGSKASFKKFLNEYNSIFLKYCLLNIFDICLRRRYFKLPCCKLYKSTVKWQKISFVKFQLYELFVEINSIVFIFALASLSFLTAGLFLIYYTISIIHIYLEYLLVINNLYVCIPWLFLKVFRKVLKFKTLEKKTNKTLCFRIMTIRAT